MIKTDEHFIVNVFRCEKTCQYEDRCLHSVKMMAYIMDAEKGGEAAGHKPTIHMSQSGIIYCYDWTLTEDQESAIQN